MGAASRCESSADANVARFYRFRDASGHVHLVDSIDSVPSALRAHAECIAYPDQPSLAARLVPRGLSNTQAFELGAVAALCVLFLFRRLPTTMRLLARIAVAGGVIALLGGAYLGWVRRQTDGSNEFLASPNALIDDAKDAVAKMNARMRAEQDELKEAEHAH